MGLTDSEVAAIQTATQSAWQQMLDVLVPQMGYNWQAFGDQDGVASNVAQSSCASVMQVIFILFRRFS